MWLISKYNEYKRRKIDAKEYEKILKDIESAKNYWQDSTFFKSISQNNIVKLVTNNFLVIDLKFYVSNDMDGFLVVWGDKESYRKSFITKTLSFEEQIAFMNRHYHKLVQYYDMLKQKTDKLKQEADNMKDRLDNITNNILWMW